MEGGYAGIPMIVCPTFSDQPVNAAKLVKLKVALSVERPTTSGHYAVKAYRGEVTAAVAKVFAEEESFSAAAEELKKQISQSGGEEVAEAVLLDAIKDGV